MKLRLFAVNSETLLERLPPEPPSASWLTDQRVRWLHIEAAPDPLLAKFLAPLGIDPILLERYRDRAGASTFVERPNVVLFSHPTPTEVGEPGSSIHIACMPTLLVSFRPEPSVINFEQWYARWIQGWPLASPTTAAILHRIMDSLGELEKETYLTLRQSTAGLGPRIRAEGANFDADTIEKLLNSVDRVSSFFFDQKLTYAALQAARTDAFSVGDEAGRFQLSASATEDISLGASQIQGRLENLQQQYMLEVQAITDRNIRVLTVLSAIFLPLTLIAGIYGMNFLNMPELDETYAYPLTLLGMGFIAAVMLAFFFWKGWLK